MLSRAALAGLLLSLCACQNMPEPYAPPVQRQPIEDYRRRFVSVVNMADYFAPKHFVQDISEKLEANWRWCQQRPTVKILPYSNEDLKFTIDFTLPEVTFKDTGPITMSFYVDNHLVDRVRYDQFGGKHFEKPIPANWVTPEQETILAAEIDKMWVSKEDGKRFGFILTRIGLTP
jgi:hypothetical protein